MLLQQLRMLLKQKLCFLQLLLCLAVLLLRILQFPLAFIYFGHFGSQLPLS